MPYFPQLLTGNLAQYPIRLTWRSRAVVNETPDGSRITSADPDAAEIEWDLSFAGLAPVEIDALRNLFIASEGALRSFVFADPAGNLLARSQEFSEAPWQPAPMLAFTPGAADPMGGTNAMAAQNNAGVPQIVKQEIDVPGTFALCFSVWIRAASGSQPITMRCFRGAASNSAVFQAGATWRRVELTSALDEPGAGVSFEIELAPGSIVELFGAQVEPQREASGYKATLDQSGVYPNARFAQDDLEIFADGFKSFAARLRIVCAPGE